MVNPMDHVAEGLLSINNIYYSIQIYLYLVWIL